MDPLVRVALGAQKGFRAISGSALAVLAGAFLVLAPASSRGSELGWAVLTVTIASLGYRAWQRYHRFEPERPEQLEIEVGLHVVVLVYAAIEHLPGGVVGPYQALAYVLSMWSGGFFCWQAALGVLVGGWGLELGLSARHGHELSDALVHGALLASFGGLNFVVFRAEIARVRRLSKSHIDSELKRMKEAARSYRLLDAPRSAISVRGVMPQLAEDDRITHASIDQLQSTLRFMLSVVRQALDLHTAAILWLDEHRGVLHLREASSSAQGLAWGPFAANEGLFAAALSSDAEVVVRGRAAARLPLFQHPEEVGCVLAVPLVENGSKVALLVVAKQAVEDFEPVARSTIVEAGHFILGTVESERLVLELQRAKTEQGKLYRAADLLAEARTEVEVIRAGVDSARQFARFDFAAVTLFHRSQHMHEICAVSGEGAEGLVGKTFRHNAGLVSMVVANQHPLPYRGAFHSSRQMVFDRHLELPAMPSLIILPLCVHETALGTLLLGSTTKGAFGEEVRPTLEVLARHVAVSLANARMVKRLEDLATTDGMTGLLNKRTLTEIARQKIRSAERFHQPLSLIVGDIDHFKRVNDTYGHDVGDQVIKGFGEVLRRSKRETDAVGRFGGEEFVLVCEHTDADGAELLAERIRQELEATTFHTQQGSLEVTCSLGVATFPVGGTDWESLFKATDEALYVSKRQGRNRVTCWQPNMRGVAA